MKPKNILVTGAAGFIGYHLCKRLIASGYNVIGYDNMNDYYNVLLKQLRITDLGIKNASSKNNKILSTKYPNFSFYKSSILDYKHLSDCVEKSEIDIIINLAAQAGVRHSLKHPHDYISDNISGFLNILEVSRYCNIKHLIYASSSSVYGLNKNLPFSTSNSTDHPTSIYGASKKSNELFAHSYSHLYNIPTTGLRFFTVYGPYGRPDMALFLFLKAIIDNKELKLFNNGKMGRDFTYVDDIVKAIEKIASKDFIQKDWNPEKPNLFNSSAPYRVYNIGNNDSVKLTDFINELELKLNKKAKIKLMPMQPGDVELTHANVDELVNDFDYKPNTPVKHGIAKFVDWYIEHQETLEKNGI